ncbi:MAG: hypothetical protein KGL46_03690 [Hyphomicrobiales bacterium]|nr:hypothetical protein [Hyphomicrobiales bacterium]
MCDYSLETYASRPARADERYETTRFSSGSIGFAAPGDKSCAICMQYDMRLALDHLPPSLCAKFGVAPETEVVFARRDGGAYKDAVRFANGAVASLQELGPGVGAVVMVEHTSPVLTDILTPVE